MISVIEWTIGKNGRKYTALKVAEMVWLPFAKQPILLFEDFL